ncbi:MAG: DUF3622 domain-containing protein [Arenicellales bacterium]|jgi:uncharacterized membrane-anchored protein
MAKGKKFDCRVLKDGDSWTAEIIRRKTSKEIVVSKSQSGFASEDDAQEWAEGELKSFLKNLNERNKRRSEEQNKSRREETTL